jgi:hypothetical protein
LIFQDCCNGIFDYHQSYFFAVNLLFILFVFLLPAIFNDYCTNIKDYPIPLVLRMCSRQKYVDRNRYKFSVATQREPTIFFRVSKQGQLKHQKVQRFFWARNSTPTHRRPRAGETHSHITTSHTNNGDDVVNAHPSSRPPPEPVASTKVRSSSAGRRRSRYAWARSEFAAVD